MPVPRLRAGRRSAALRAVVNALWCQACKQLQPSLEGRAVYQSSCARLRVAIRCPIHLSEQGEPVRPGFAFAPGKRVSTRLAKASTRGACRLDSTIAGVYALYSLAMTPQDSDFAMGLVHHRDVSEHRRDPADRVGVDLERQHSDDCALVTLSRRPHAHQQARKHARYLASLWQSTQSVARARARGCEPSVSLDSLRQPTQPLGAREQDHLATLYLIYRMSQGAVIKHLTILCGLSNLLARVRMPYL